VMWNHVGMARTAGGCKKAIEEIKTLREEFWNDLRIPGEANHVNPNLEHATRLADFLDFAEIVARDALLRNESCGCHFREEYQTAENEAKRDDEHFSHAGVFEYQGEGKEAIRYQEELKFECIHLSQRSYK